MLNWLQKVLTADEVTQAQTYLSDAAFIDGKKTAGYRAQRVKHNQQLDIANSQRDYYNKIILNALQRHDAFQAIALPKRIHRPLISRYQLGMEYGTHVDDALMDKPNALRADIAVTIFLNDPGDYDGGELAVTTSLGEQSIKLPAGDAVVYPASTLHKVAPVIRGQRLAAVTWVQSYVRDIQQREILADLARVQRKLNQLAADCKETDLAYKSYSNLLRMWAET